VLAIGAVLAAESGSHESYIDTAGSAVIAILLFWLAHAYADVLGHRLQTHTRLNIAILGQALRDEAAILTGAVPALLAVLLCWIFGVALATGVEAALWTTVASLLAFELLAGIRARATPRELVFEAGVVERHAVPEELVQPLRVGARQFARELDQLGVAPAHARAHDLVVAGSVGLVLKHQVVAVRGEQLLVGHPHRLHHVFALRRGAPLAVVGGGGAKGVGNPLKAPLQRRVEELARGREQAEHIRLRDAHAPRDALDRGAVQAAARELVHGGRDQLLATLGRGDSPAHGLL
jgi:hypothetical protein